ncbi:MAG: hypothetical protein R2911_00890 [Caldilineaceae bacterium]
MFIKRISMLMSAALIAGMLSMAAAPSAFAVLAERAGYSPASAAAPNTAMHELQPGQWDWYVFKAGIPPLHGLSQSQRMAQDKATLDVTMNIARGTGRFEVWNQTTLHDWLTNVKYTPFGQSTENYLGQRSTDVDGKVIPNYWAGEFNEGGTYYLIVKNTGNTPMFYSLNTVEQNITFPSSLTVPNVK